VCQVVVRRISCS